MLSGVYAKQFLSCQVTWSPECKILQTRIQDFPKGGLTTARESGVYPLPCKAETINVCNKPDFVPFRRKSMSEIRMEAFCGIFLILMCRFMQWCLCMLIFLK